MANDNRLGGLSDAVKKANPVGDDDMFPTSLTEEEEGFGFEVVEITNPTGHYAFAPGKIRAAIAPLPDDLLAVKTADPNGQIAFAIWNQDHRPVDHIAATIEELRRRFPA